MSLSARRVTLPAITPLVLQKRVGGLFGFVHPRHFSVCLYFSVTVCIYCQLRALHNREGRLECIETTGT